MAFGEPLLDDADDISAIISRLRGRLAIIAARQRVNLTEKDEAEFEGALDDLDLLLTLNLELRQQVSLDYLRRIGKG